MSLKSHHDQIVSVFQSFFNWFLDYIIKFCSFYIDFYITLWYYCALRPMHPNSHIIYNIQNNNRKILMASWMIKLKFKAPRWAIISLNMLLNISAGSSFSQLDLWPSWKARRRLCYLFRTAILPSRCRGSSGYNTALEITSRLGRWIDSVTSHTRKNLTNEWLDASMCKISMTNH